MRACGAYAAKSVGWAVAINHCGTIIGGRPGLPTRAADEIW